MIRWIVAAALALAPLALSPSAARAQTDQQELVDRATLTVQDMMNGSEQGGDVRALMRKAKGAMICPRVFKAGFFIGGQGGGCVLVGRVANGWSGPAFYGMGSGSIGFQFGIQDAQVMLIVLTDKGLRALLDSQFKIGADASVAIATIGGGIQGATTAAFNADIVAFQITRGLFAGIALDGGLIGARSQWNEAYYGQPLAAQQIVLQGTAQNPGADPLREMLARFANADGQPPAYAAAQVPPAPAPIQLAPGGSRTAVQAAPLPPPRR